VIQNLRQHLDASISVEIIFSTSAEARAVLKALLPDNVSLPKGLSMKMLSRKSNLAIEVTGKNIPVATVLRTIDEVLEHISVSQKVLMAD
jgi:tRNA threonylcarbamoyladenosine modification (KEOPS) complex  Pcc1 subunit